MDAQTIIVTIIILAALIYVGVLVGRKVMAFTPKNACGSGCGCESNSKTSKIKL